MLCLDIAAYEASCDPLSSLMQVLHIFNEALTCRRSPSIKVSYLSETADSTSKGQAMVLDVLINATPLRDAEGTLYGVLGIAQDISDSRCVDVDLERARVTQVCPPMNLSLCHCLFTPVFLWCLLPSLPLFPFIVKPLRRS